MATNPIIPLTCTEAELLDARVKYSAYLGGKRPSKIVVDGEVTEWALVSPEHLLYAIRCMEAYLRKQAGDEPARVIQVYANSKGF